ncbi:MAG: hypothetical protein PWQ95_2190 [Thermococcaceae archaeon]|nr:hypothetical protein [Thermococcaceae archaeon]
MLDVRGLKPPQPALMILENLERLKTGETLEVLGDKPFVDIIPKLEEAGYQVELNKVGEFFVLKVTKTEGSKEQVRLFTAPEPCAQKNPRKDGNAETGQEAHRHERRAL